MTRRCLPLTGSQDELALQSAGFAALRRGEIPNALQLAPSAGLTPVRAQRAFESLLDRESLMVTDDGHIDGIAGLTLRTTRHMLIMDGRVSHTWCGFDAVGIPAALGVDAVARTSCGHCGDPLEVSFTLGSSDSPHLWGWMPALDPGERSLITNFCSKANLFCSRDHLDAWYLSAGRPDGDPATMDELADMGRSTWEHCAA